MIKRIIAITATLIFVYTMGGQPNVQGIDNDVGIRRGVSEGTAGDCRHDGKTVTAVPGVEDKAIRKQLHDKLLSQRDQEMAVEEEDNADERGNQGELGEADPGVSEDNDSNNSGEPEEPDAEPDAEPEGGCVDPYEGAEQDIGEDSGQPVEDGSIEVSDVIEETPEEDATFAEEVQLSEPQYLGCWAITAYCPCEQCCGVWAGGSTSSGVPAVAGHTVACNSLPAGTRIMIDGWEYVVEDTGYTEYGDDWIDIFFSTHEEALAWGVQWKDVYLVG